MSDDYSALIVCYTAILLPNMVAMLCLGPTGYIEGIMSVFRSIFGIFD